jgi:single-strand DNA-binding protein
MKNMQLTGNLGRDPESRYTPQGKMVTTANVAVNSGFGDNKTTEWIKLTFWEKSAETFAKLAAKGTKVWISGTPKIETWQGKDKGFNAQINITVRDWEILAGYAEKEDSDNPYNDSAEAVDEVLQGE